MNYEQKYKEALNKAKDMLHYKEVRREDMEYIFPELKENEDERIRKWLLRVLATYELDSYLRDKALAWLEKHKPADNEDARKKYLDELLVADDIYQMAVNDDMVTEAKSKAINALSKLEISKLLDSEKHKPVELSEEDKEMLEKTIYLVEMQRNENRSDCEYQQAEKAIVWLKSLKQRITKQD